MLAFVPGNRLGSVRRQSSVWFIVHECIGAQLMRMFLLEFKKIIIKYSFILNQYTCVGPCPPLDRYSFPVISPAGSICSAISGFSCECMCVYALITSFTTVVVQFIVLFSMHS